VIRWPWKWCRSWLATLDVLTDRALMAALREAELEPELDSPSGWPGQATNRARAPFLIDVSREQARALEAELDS
jgi:hypothetical protein